MMMMLVMMVVVMMMMMMTIVMLATNYRTDDGDDENGDKTLFGAICFPSTQMKKTTSRHPQPRRKTTYANYREGATPVTHHGETGLPQFHNLPYLISGENEWPNYLLRHRGDATRPAKHKKNDSMATLNQLPHVIN